MCVIDIFSKYSLVFPLKDKKGVTITNAFQIIFKRILQKIKSNMVDKGSEF